MCLCHTVACTRVRLVRFVNHFAASRAIKSKTHPLFGLIRRMEDGGWKCHNGRGICLHTRNKSFHLLWNSNSKTLFCKCVRAVVYGPLGKLSRNCSERRSHGCSSPLHTSRHSALSPADVNLVTRVLSDVEASSQTDL